MTLAYVRACGGDIVGWERRWRQLARQIDGPPPYPGFAPFGMGDADRFSGREALVAELMAQVRQRHVVGVFGPSGSGKSSLLYAGLAAGMSDTRVAVSTPTEWLSVGVNDVDLVMVDKFEELFLHITDRREREAFVAALLGGEHRVVLAARADFLGRCLAIPALADALHDAKVLVGPMAEEDLRSAIEEPAHAAGLRIEPEMRDAALAEARGRAGAAPLLSRAMRETWRRRERGSLTLAGYRCGGGVVGAALATAECTYVGLSHRERMVARAVLMRLVRTGDHAGGSCFRAALDEVLSVGRSSETARVITVLAAARVVVVGQDWIEPAHEGIVRSWPRLREWIVQDRELLSLHRDLTVAAAHWESTGRDTTALYRGRCLAATRELVRRDDWGVVSTRSEREFVLASHDRERTGSRPPHWCGERSRALGRALVTMAAAASVAAAWRRFASEHGASPARRRCFRQPVRRAHTGGRTERIPGA
ncbi:nSTAND1 domain-containing NTPase [Saccharomonospora iraqiensis]|uniref:nSTAND1 domain-containing NTPase n=1 Tax=Saccharomonospora iraqiensis TaxID=52698 RepID=UPI0002FA200F|nr:hypothetical protein [Saccharomonospora iraqiensis]